GEHRPRLGVEEDLRAFALLGAELPSAVEVAAQEPLAVPSVLGDVGEELVLQSTVVLRVVLAAGLGALGAASELDELRQPPQEEERRKERLSLPPEVQAVVPVRGEAETEAVAAPLRPGEIDGALEVLVHRTTALVSEGDLLLEPREVTGLA